MILASTDSLISYLEIYIYYKEIHNFIIQIKKENANVFTKIKKRKTNKNPNRLLFVFLFLL
ncbi:NH(3)-dependent NAD synthetase [Enterococcus faecalis]|nr:NH(3)-dependent NAD synthetase [Enterococcus faecalis]